MLRKSSSLVEQAARKTKLVSFAIGLNRSRNSAFPIIRGKTPDLAALYIHRFLADVANDEIASEVNELGSILAPCTQQDFRFFILLK